MPLRPLVRAHARSGRSHGPASRPHPPIWSALDVLTGSLPDQDRLVLGAWGALLDAPGCLAAEASGLPASPYVWWQVEQTGYIVPDDTQPADRSALEVERTYLGADGKAKTEFSTGERVTVRVRVKSFAGESAVRDAVVTDLLPGGFGLGHACGGMPRRCTRMPPCRRPCAVGRACAHQLGAAHFHLHRAGSLSGRL